ncbi:MAG TPA: hypothetical protein PK198_14770, partial [Saprospiraceae bacterium]|nr:hypothetical protein [Saprospiraceae bacterium]
PVTASAAFIETVNTDRIKDGIRVFDDPADLYQTITAATGRPYTELKAPETPHAAKTIMMPAITNISPLSVAAG